MKPTISFKIIQRLFQIKIGRMYHLLCSFNRGRFFKVIIISANSSRISFCLDAGNETTTL